MTKYNHNHSAMQPHKNFRHQQWEQRSIRPEKETQAKETKVESFRLRDTLYRISDSLTSAIYAKRKHTYFHFSELPSSKDMVICTYIHISLFRHLQWMQGIKREMEESNRANNKQHNRRIVVVLGAPASTAAAERRKHNETRDRTGQIQIRQPQAQQK